MASMTSNPLKLPPLGRKNMAQLIARARDVGVPPEDYARQLVEDGLALQREAESMTISEIMAPVRKAAGKVDDGQILRLVEKARADHHRIAARGKRR